MLLKKPSFYLAVAGIVGTVLLVNQLRAKPPIPPPLAEPTRSPFANTLAATGIIEAVRENVRIATPKSGLIQKVFVDVGSSVKEGDPLLLLDDREARSQLDSAKSQLAALEASVKLDEVQTADLEDQLGRVQKLARDRVASDDELKRKEFALQAMQAHLGKSKADLVAAKQQVEQAKVELEILTVRAPRDGVILQLNTRSGEYANVLATDPLMILGEVNRLQIRGDIDEQNAPLFEPGQPAVAYLKGDTKNQIPLHFVRVEPFVVPKKSLTGDSTERVDTRVLQVIYQLERPSTPLYVGQQVDVFIQRSASLTSKEAPVSAPKP